MVVAIEDTDEESLPLSGDTLPSSPGDLLRLRRFINSRQVSSELEGVLDVFIHSQVGGPAKEVINRRQQVPLKSSHTEPPTHTY